MHMVDILLSYVFSTNPMTSSVGSFTDMLGYSYEYDTDTNYISNFDIFGNYITLSVTPTYDNLGKTEKREIFAEVGSNLAFHSEIFYTYETSNQNESNLVSQYASRVELSNLARGTVLKVVWQPGWERSSGGRMAELLCCPPETITTLLIGYILIHNKK